VGAALLPAAALAAAVSVPALAATRTVRIGDNWFLRERGVPTLAVRRGDTVRWRWIGRSIHNVTVLRGPVHFRSATKKRGTFTRRLTRVGTYRIICTVHGPRDQSMVLEVR
jgi:plastocyanin